MLHLSSSSSSSILLTNAESSLDLDLDYVSYMCLKQLKDILTFPLCSLHLCKIFIIKCVWRSFYLKTAKMVTSDLTSSQLPYNYSLSSFTDCSDLHYLIQSWRVSSFFVLNNANPYLLVLRGHSFQLSIEVLQQWGKKKKIHWGTKSKGRSWNWHSSRLI